MKTIRTANARFRTLGGEPPADDLEQHPGRRGRRSSPLRLGDTKNDGEVLADPLQRGDFDSIGGRRRKQGDGVVERS